MNLIFFYILCVVIYCVNSAIIYDDQVEIPGQEGKCYDKDAKIFYSKEEIIESEKTECAQRKCLGFLEKVGKVRIEILTCPVAKAGPGCTILQDPSKPYPDCCPQVVSLPSIEPKLCERQKLEQE